eukprot:71253-Pelagomonas_calceolata.AAC.1
MSTQTQKDPNPQGANANRVRGGTSSHQKEHPCPLALRRMERWWLAIPNLFRRRLAEEAKTGQPSQPALGRADDGETNLKIPT